MTDTADRTAAHGALPRRAPLLPRVGVGSGPHRRRVVGAARHRGLVGPDAGPRPRYGRGLSRADAGARGPGDRRVRRPRRPGRPRPAARRRRRSPPTAPTSRRHATSATSSPARRAGASCSASPAPAPTSPGSTAKAVKDGEEWIVNGQKVWTSARPGRRPRHAHRPHRPRRPQAPGHHLLRHRHAPAGRRGAAAAGDDRPRAVQRGLPRPTPACPTDAVIGELDNGWAVANTTLAFERAGLGAGGGRRRPRPATPGTVAGDLDKRRRRLRRQPRRRRAARRAGRHARSAPTACSSRLAKGNGTVNDPSIRQELMQLHTLGELARFNGQRLKAAKAAGRDIPGMANIAKLSMSEHRPPVRATSACASLGPDGMLHAYDGEDREVARRGDRATRSSADAHRDGAVRPGARRSTAAPTRSSATSSASACSACPRSRARPATRPSRSSPRTADPRSRHAFVPQRYESVPRTHGSMRRCPGGATTSEPTAGPRPPRRGRGPRRAGCLLRRRRRPGAAAPTRERPGAGRVRPDPVGRGPLGPRRLLVPAGRGHARPAGGPGRAGRGRDPPRRRGRVDRCPGHGPRRPPVRGGGGRGGPRRPRGGRDGRRGRSGGRRGRRRPGPGRRRRPGGGGRGPGPDRRPHRHDPARRLARPGRAGAPRSSTTSPPAPRPSC